MTLFIYKKEMDKVHNIQIFGNRVVASTGNITVKINGQEPDIFYRGKNLTDAEINKFKKNMKDKKILKKLTKVTTKTKMNHSVLIGQK